VAPTEPDVALRPATSEDVPAVAALHVATRRASEPLIPPQVHTDVEVHDWVAGLLDRHDVATWVALAGDQVAGYVTFTETWLDDLYVAPLHQRAGIGSALLELVKSQRPAGFSLWVFESNEPARAFYRAHGLVELERTDGADNEERAPDLEMAWLGDEPLTLLRRRIDAVDDELAVLLARRTALTAAVQDHKEVGGRAGRDPDREAEIIDRMVGHVPGMDRERVARIMHTVIEESLAAWEERPS
jgi:chorismate mutase/ribosomal protein S18 acetylase RimI-like enzyme